MIYTLNAKDNVLFQVIKSTNKLSDIGMYQNIEAMYEELIVRLKKKGISYESLKRALVPDQDKDRFETCFVFDSLKVSDSNYGNQIFQKIIPLLDKDSTYSILCGDYIDSGKSTDSQLVLSRWLNEVLVVVNSTNYKASSQYYLIYINRLSKGQRQQIIEGLSGESWFVGYVDVTHQSPFKSYLSQILVHSYIKQKCTIIAPHPSDYSDDENVKMRYLPFEESGFRFVSISEESYHPFLSYKIESAIVDRFDISTSLNALFPKFRKMQRLRLIVERKKWYDYLFKDGQPKQGILRSLGFSISEKKRFEKEIRHKVDSNYIYNLIIDKEHNTLKFDVCVEFNTIHDRKRKTTIALEYIPNKRVLRLITIT